MNENTQQIDKELKFMLIEQMTREVNQFERDLEKIKIVFLKSKQFTISLLQRLIINEFIIKSF